MRRNSRIIMIGVALLLVIMLHSVSFATGPLYGVTKETKMTRKLLRGFLNIPFCVMEIPLEINKEIQLTDPFTGFWVGLVNGSVKTWKRGVTGVWEVLTFPIEVPEGYKPLCDPEFPMMDIVD